MRARVGDDAWVTLSPAPWQVRLATVPGEHENPEVLTVVRAGTETVLATGGRAPGDVIEFVDGGRACRLRVDGTYAEDDTVAPDGMKQPRPRTTRRGRTAASS